MILELDTALFDIGNISINQLVFLTLCLNENQIINQDVHEFLSRISEAEIQSLIDQGLITSITDDNNKTYCPTQKLLDSLKTDKTMFDEFYEAYPIYVTRPDGTKGFLRANIAKCRKEYNRAIGKSSAMHHHLLDCLKFELDNKTMSGKIGYMKTMWKWITQREWETVEEELKVEGPVINNQNYGYGTAVI